MKALILALTLAMTTVAAAQISWPRTLKVHDNKTGQVIGTATLSGNRMVIRDINGELVGTAVFDAKGKTLYDPHGKVVTDLSIAAPEQLPPEAQ